MSVIVQDVQLPRGLCLEFRFLALTCACVALLSIAWSGSATAQNHPFAVGTSEPLGAPTSGIIGWIIAQQNAFHQAISSTLKASREDGGFWALIALSFGYGVFHAAGPGHGKAVITAYIVANEQALKRGLVLTLAAALLQGLVAVFIVGVGAFIFNATAQKMNGAAQWIEDASYLTIAMLGLWLMARKGMALAAALRINRVAPAYAFPQSFMQSGAAGKFTCEAVDPGHIHTASCNHFHAPDPAILTHNFSWGGALATVVAAGARPCSGAILILVFCLSQGVFWLGVLATISMSLGTSLTTGVLAAFAVFAKDYANRLGGGGARSILVGRLVEFLAAIVVFMVGAILLSAALKTQGL